MSGAADLANNATLTGGGAVQLPDASASSMTWVFMLPPDYKAGSTVAVDIYVGKPGGAACSAVFASEAATAPVNNDQVDVSVSPQSSAVNFGATAGNVFLV